MTTIINSPPSSDSNVSSVFIGVFVLVVLGMIFFYYGLPAIRQIGQSNSPQINVPEKIDVNINQTP
jgi:hypothetical protein